MADNKIQFVPQWQIIGSVSTPESGYKKIYPKLGGDYWYVVDESGNEKRLELGLTIKNGLTTTTLAPTSTYRSQIDIALGLGLTFSGNFAGSTISVFNVIPSMLRSLGSATAGYILSTTGSTFNWIPFDVPGISGTTNKIAKFNSSSTIGDSLMSDDGSKVVIGVTPSFGIGLLNVGGNFYVSGSVYLNDSVNTFIKYDTGISMQTDRNFVVKDELGYDYLSLMTDNISYYTFSVLNNSLVIGDDSVSRYLSASNLGLVYFGNTSSSLTYSLYSSTPGILKLYDSTQGINKLLVSDSDGVGTWQSLSSGNGIISNGLTISVGLTGYGLSSSSNYLFLDYSIFGSTLTYSTGVVDLNNSGVTAGAYGGSGVSTQVYVDTYGRVTNVYTYSIPSTYFDDYINAPYDKGLTANNVVVNGGTATDFPITHSPIPTSYVTVYVNGQEFQVGNGTTNSSCYFGTNSNSPRGFSASNYIQSGDYLYWNPSVAGFNLEDTFKISYHYLIVPSIYTFAGVTGPVGATATQNLATTLSIGNTTSGNNITLSSGDVINSSSGGGQLNLRTFSTDGVWTLSSDSGSFGKSWIYGSSVLTQVGYSASSYALFENESAFIGVVNSNDIFGYIGTNGTGYENTSEIGIVTSEMFLLSTNATTSVYSSFNKGIAINSGNSIKPTVFNAGVDFSVALGGSGLTVKKNYAAYCNQLAIQNISSAFELLIDSDTLTADRIQSHQDLDGTIALVEVDIDVPVIAITSTASPYNVSWGEDIEVDCTGGGVIINLPLSVGNNGKKASIIRVDGTANTITIQTSGGETLNGSISFGSLVSQYDTLTVKANGTINYYWR